MSGIGQQNFNFDKVPDNPSSGETEEGVLRRKVRAGESLSPEERDIYERIVAEEKKDSNPRNPWANH